ncbi:discoidin domain-containing protein [Aestuariimicrobium sp. Y1814]|uniref:discoidin domain-containing protein n=1 Tax=Aestuariimicrobium sp. Y1814 TaxID=3418742 RepID=UPI003DA77322
MPLLAAVAVVLGLMPLAQQASAAPTNLALNRPVTASGQELADRWGPELAVDGNAGPEGSDVAPAVHNAPDASRWSSNSADSVWIQVDLGEAATISEVNAHWGNTYPTQWSVSTSADGENWTDVVTEGAGPGVRGGWTNWTGTAEDVRYVKVTTHGRSAPWGTGLWELEVMGEAAPAPVTNLAVDRPVAASGDELPDRWGAELAVDGDSGPEGNDVPTSVHNAAEASRWSSNSADSVWIQVDLGNTAVVSEIKAHWGNTWDCCTSW